VFESGAQQCRICTKIIRIFQSNGRRRIWLCGPDSTLLTKRLGGSF
jgi:hypothetical protein